MKSQKELLGMWLSENHPPTEDEVLLALEKFADKWDTKYPQISRSWTTHRENSNTLFNYPEDIRKAIYTTNAIESLNSVIRKAIKKTQAVPNRRIRKKGHFLINPGCVKEVDDAY